MEVPEDCDRNSLKDLLSRIGYTLMCESEDKVSFNKGYTEEGFAKQVYHLHIRGIGNRDEVYFGDYLNENPAVAKEYETLKLHLWKQYEYNRDAYTEAKTDFVTMYTALAKQQFH